MICDRASPAENRFVERPRGQSINPRASAGALRSSRCVASRRVGSKKESREDEKERKERRAAGKGKEREDKGERN